MELALAIQKNNRTPNNENYEAVIDEIADVIIMMEQAKGLFPIDKINERIEFKIKRLAERMK